MRAFPCVGKRHGAADAAGCSRNEGETIGKAAGVVHGLTVNLAAACVARGADGTGAAQSTSGDAPWVRRPQGGCFRPDRPLSHRHGAVAWREGTGRDRLNRVPKREGPSVRWRCNRGLGMPTPSFGVASYDAPRHFFGASDFDWSISSLAILTASS